jgi:hypothetical protein
MPHKEERVFTRHTMAAFTLRHRCRTVNDTARYPLLLAHFLHRQPSAAAHGAFRPEGRLAQRRGHRQRQRRKSGAATEGAGAWGGASGGGWFLLLSREWREVRLRAPPPASVRDLPALHAWPRARLRWV